MEKMLERAVLFAYRRVIALGGWHRGIRRRHCPVLFDARPDMEDSEARNVISNILATDPSLRSEGSVRPTHQTH